MQMEAMWGVLGNVSNAIAALCAVAAICVTVWNFRSDKKEQKKEKLNAKLSELYKQAIIDSMLKTEDEKIRYINEKLYKMSLAVFDKNVMEELSEYMMSGMHECLAEAEIIKLFSKELCKEVKQITERIIDTYSGIINKSMQHGYISQYFEQQINKEWIKLKSSVYECYIKENFDKLEYV